MNFETLYIWDLFFRLNCISCLILTLYQENYRKNLYAFGSMSTLLTLDIVGQFINIEYFFFHTVFFLYSFSIMSLVMNTNDVLSYFNFIYNTYHLFHINYLFFFNVIESNIINDTAPPNNNSAKMMKKILKINVCKNPEKECYICLESINENPNLRQFSCSHTFHPECIGKWLGTRYDETCPVCRQQLFETHC